MTPFCSVYKELRGRDRKEEATMRTPNAPGKCTNCRNMQPQLLGALNTGASLSRHPCPVPLMALADCFKESDKGGVIKKNLLH